MSAENAIRQALREQHKRACEWTGCHIEDWHAKMRRTESGGWYCPDHYRGMVDCDALDAIRDMMSGTIWGGADMLDAIAAVVSSTGRTIEEATDEAPEWDA